MVNRATVTIILASIACALASGCNLAVHAPAPTLLPGVTISFASLGQAIDPLNVRLAEPGSIYTAPAPGRDVWLKISNRSDRVIEFATDSVYLRPLSEWDQRPDGTRLLSLKDGSRISIAYGVEDSKGRSVPYGLDFHWTSRLKPGDSAFFSVPRSVFLHDHSIYVGYTTEEPPTGAKSRDEFKVLFRSRDVPVEPQ